MDATPKRSEIINQSAFTAAYIFLVNHIDAWNPTAPVTRDIVDANINNQINIIILVTGVDAGRDVIKYAATSTNMYSPELAGAKKDFHIHW